MADHHTDAERVPLPDEQRELDRLARRGWGEVPERLATTRAVDDALDCGWGRLVFGQTYDDPRKLANVLAAESLGRRDVCLYAKDPHVVIGMAPQELFLDPSHTYRLQLGEYQPEESSLDGMRIRTISELGDAEQINRIYRSLGMVPAPIDLMWKNQRGATFTYLVAEVASTGQIMGTVTGVDHVAAIGDPEGGTSLWCLAVDPHCTTPGVGEALVRNLVERYRAEGRTWLDLSVIHDNTPAIRLYEKLGFHRVPIYCIKRKNPVNEKLFVPETVDRISELNPYAKLLADEALRRGIDVEVVDPAVGEMRMTLGSRSILMWESLSELTSAVAMSRCDDKAVTRRVLRDAGLRIPHGRLAGTEEENLALLKSEGELVVKPARGEQGKGITVGVRTADQLAAAIDLAREHCSRVLLEQRVAGDDLRVVVIDGNVVAAAVRRPATVVGDGKHSIRQLIDTQSRRRNAATGGESVIPLDATTEECVAEAGWAMSDVPPTGHIVQVRKTANLHTGGTIHDVTDELHPRLANVAVAAAEAIEIPVTGIDLIVSDVGSPEYVIIEANERPGLANHEPHPTAERFVDLLFPATSSLPRFPDGGPGAANYPENPGHSDYPGLPVPESEHPGDEDGALEAGDQAPTEEEK